MDSTSVPFGGLNIVLSRGKWYVMTRKKPTTTFIRGFVGSRQDVVELLHRPDIAERIVKAECGNRKGVSTHRDAFRDAVAKRVSVSCRKRAAERDIEYSLSQDWFYDQLLLSGDKCSITGLPFDYRPRSKKDGWHKNPYAPSPDRIDRSVGYTPRNVRIVLASVNIAINEWGLDHLKIIANQLQASSLSSFLQKP